MDIKLSSTAKTIGAIAAIIIAITGVSLATWLKHGKEIWRAPYVNAVQDSVISKQTMIIMRLHSKVNFHEHAQEMNFQLFRLMTNDMNTDRYKVTVESQGTEYEIDVRTFIDSKLAFIYKLNIVYPIYTDPADGRYYIIFHDFNKNGNLALYLEPL